MTSTTRPMAAPQFTGSFGKRLTAVALLTACLLARPATAQPSNEAPATKVPADRMTVPFVGCPLGRPL